MRQRSGLLGIVVAPVLLLLMTPPSAFGQAEGTGISCIPVGERAGREFGCFIVATQEIGRLDSAHVFWHVSMLADGSARSAPDGPRGTVVEAMGKSWLLTIADAGWRPSQGTHVAAIGPLPITAGDNETGNMTGFWLFPFVAVALIVFAATRAQPGGWRAAVALLGVVTTCMSVLLLFLGMAVG